MKWIKREAERAKKALSEENPVLINLQDEEWKLDFQCTLTRKEFVEYCSDLFE